MREANFQKMNKLNKDKWSCVKCRTTTAAVCNTSITQDDNTFVGSNEKLLGLTESVKFLSNQFDVFSKQLNEVLNSIKDLKEENKKLKKTNEPNENCKEVVELIASKLGVKIAVVNAFRTYTKSSNRPRKMIAILHSMENKQNVMEPAKKKETEYKYGKCKLGK
ncbi:hypothetical protein QTP88_022325 [Uroleucon formosanum]